MSGMISLAMQDVPGTAKLKFFAAGPNGPRYSCDLHGVVKARVLQARNGKSYKVCEECLWNDIKDEVQWAKEVEICSEMQCDGTGVAQCRKCGQWFCQTHLTTMSTCCWCAED